MKKNVNLRITSTQYSENLVQRGETFVRDLEKEDSLEILTEGTMYNKNNATYITYEENAGIGTEDGRTLFRLEGTNFRIRRYGDDDDGLEMTLEPGLKSITRYQMPMMRLDMEVYTNSVESDLDEEGYGKVAVDYRIKFDRFFSRRNILEIEVKRA